MLCPSVSWFEGDPPPALGKLWKSRSGFCCSAGWPKISDHLHKLVRVAAKTALGQTDGVSRLQPHKVRGEVALVRHRGSAEQARDQRLNVTKRGSNLQPDPILRAV